MNKWQDISTAPKDGTEILILVPRFTPSVFAAVWRDTVEVPFWSGMFHYWYPNEVTHWMPLPEPPHPAL